MFSTPLILLCTLLTGVSVALTIPWIGDAWDAVSGAYMRDLLTRLHDLRIDEKSIRRWLRWWGATLVATVVLFGPVLGLWPVAAALVYLLLLAPRVGGSLAVRARTRKMRDQTVGAVTALANMCRAGLSLAQGLESVANETPEPLAGEFRRVVREYQSGRPLRDALLERREQLQLDSFNLFSSAVVICLERGGKVTEALDRIARSLLEMQRLERKIEADTQSGRRVAVLLGIFPFLFLAGFYVLDPEGTGLIFTTLVGQIVLVAVIAIVYFCMRWTDKIVSIDV
jgi:tight adherence protein B